MLASEYPPWIGVCLRRLEQKGPPAAQEIQKQGCTPLPPFSWSFLVCQLVS